MYCEDYTSYLGRWYNNKAIQGVKLMQEKDTPLANKFYRKCITHYVQTSMDCAFEILVSEAT